MGSRLPFHFSAHPNDFTDEWTLAEATFDMHPGDAYCVRQTASQVVSAFRVTGCGT